MSKRDLRGIIPKIMSWLDNKPDTSAEDDEEDANDDNKDVIIDEEDTKAGEEEAIIKAKGKSFLSTSLFEVVEHVTIR
jgi:hypothetical protein